MKKMAAIFGAGFSLFLITAMNVGAEQKDAPTEKPQPAEAAGSVDHANAYYHYMLARRFRDQQYRISTRLTNGAMKACRCANTSRGM